MAKDNFKKDAKQVVDILFDGGLFKEDITRNKLDIIEEFIYEYMTLKYAQHIRNIEFQKTIDALNTPNKQ